MSIIISIKLKKNAIYNYNVILWKKRQEFYQFIGHSLQNKQFQMDDQKERKQHPSEGKKKVQDQSDIRMSKRKAEKGLILKAFLNEQEIVKEVYKNILLKTVSLYHFINNKQNLPLSSFIWTESFYKQSLMIRFKIMVFTFLVSHKKKSVFFPEEKNWYGSSGE